MRVWLIFIAGGIATYLARASFLVFGRNLVLPAFVERSLRYVAPAAFAALTASLLIGSEPDNIGPRVASLAVAGLAIWKTQNFLVSLIAGMGSLWLLNNLF